MKRMPATEAQIQRTITDWLTLAGIPWTLTDAAHVTINGITKGRAKVRKGWPDVTAILPPSGRALLIEVKSANGRLRRDQEEVIETLKAVGASVCVARSVEEVATGIDGLFYRSGYPMPPTIRRAIQGLEAAR